MKVIVAPDKFRGSLSAAEAARAMARGVLRADRKAEVVQIPMADGGEGTVEALVADTNGCFLKRTVTGPLGDPVQARFGMLGDGATAVIEMAEASGLRLIPSDRRDPSRTTTRGTGELLLEAIAAGARKIVLGIGGSATNDGGLGFSQALGFRFLDSQGQEIGPGGGSLELLDRIDSQARNPLLDGVEIVVACDVDNPLCGPRGASAIFGPQKGADATMIARLDRNLNHFASIVLRDKGIDLRDRPGGGAAGGLGAGLMAFANGTLASGVELVLQLVGMERKLEGADLVLTGEGRIDGSSASGKTAVGVARLARSRGIPVFAIVGDVAEGAEVVHDEGIDAYFSLCPGPISLENAIEQAAKLIENASCEVMRAFLAARAETSMSQSSGEFDLIAQIRERTPWGDRVSLGIGDDCAALRFTPGREVVVTTDMLMDGRHFRLGPASAREIGYKSLAVNLSDIAAMAAIPIAAVVAVALPRDRAEEIARGIHEGMLPLAEAMGVSLVGGDTNGWDGPLVVSVTVLGEASERGIVRRSGARPGDVIFVTGPLGGSLLGRHLRPIPRVHEALAFHKAVAIQALIDLSDGLSSDLGHILDESGGVGAILDAGAIPIHPDARAMAASDGRSPLDHALNDGEDFELCLVVSPADAERLRAHPSFAAQLFSIGTIVAEAGLVLRNSEWEIRVIERRGFDHFRGASRCESSETHPA